MNKKTKFVSRAMFSKTTPMSSLSRSQHGRKSSCEKVIMRKAQIWTNHRTRQRLAISGLAYAQTLQDFHNFLLIPKRKPCYATPPQRRWNVTAFLPPTRETLRKPRNSDGAASSKIVFHLPTPKTSPKSICREGRRHL